MVRHKEGSDVEGSQSEWEGSDVGSLPPKYFIEIQKEERPWTLWSGDLQLDDIGEVLKRWREYDKSAKWRAVKVTTTKEVIQ
ncbi:MAG TPA: hypothetical protein VL854_07060 [Nitrososphaeraceae archaeon]|nr:hypothetical protein [Nitrososphaeraceae archaeon]